MCTTEGTVVPPRKLLGPCCSTLRALHANCAGLSERHYFSYFLWQPLVHVGLPDTSVINLSDFKGRRPGQYECKLNFLIIITTTRKHILIIFLNHFQQVTPRQRTHVQQIQRHKIIYAHSVSLEVARICACVVLGFVWFGIGICVIFVVVVAPTHTTPLNLYFFELIRCSLHYINILLRSMLKTTLANISGLLQS